MHFIVRQSHHLEFLLLQMASLENTRTIRNEDICNDKAGQIELTTESVNKIEFDG